MLTLPLLLLTEATYAAATGLIAWRMSRHNPRHPPRELVLGLCGLGLILHATLIALQMHSDGGLNLSFFNAFSLVGWTVLLLLLLSALTKPVEMLALPLLPLSMATLVLEYLRPSTRLLGESTPWGLMAHVVISILAYSLLTLASLQAIALAIQHRQLHNRHPGGLIRLLPPLQTMEDLLFEMISFGFLLLTLSLASGFAFLENMFLQHLVHKTVLSIIAWTVFGVLLIGRLRYGWRGRTAIKWTLSGFAALMLAYFGSKAVIELMLGR